MMMNNCQEYESLLLQHVLHCNKPFHCCSKDKTRTKLSETTLELLTLNIHLNNEDNTSKQGVKGCMFPLNQL